MSEKDIEPTLNALLNAFKDDASDAGLSVDAIVNFTPMGAKLQLFLVSREFAQDVKNSIKYKELTSDFISSVEEELEKRGKYRKPEERPDPAQGPNAEVNRNRTTAVFSARISPDIIDLANDFQTSSGKTKREIVEAALLLYMASENDGP